MSGQLLAVFPCGTSMAVNLRQRLYCERRARPSRAGCEFVGFYADKQVQHIGRIQDVVEGSWDGKAFTCSRPELGPLPADTLARIEAACRRLAEKFETIRTEHQRFYLLDELHETRFVKASKHGLWQGRTFNLSEWLDYSKGQRYTAKDVAAALRRHQWA